MRQENINEFVALFNGVSATEASEIAKYIDRLIDQEKRSTAIAFHLWMHKEGYYVPNSNIPMTWRNGPRNEWPQMCYTIDELYDLYINSL